MTHPHPQDIPAPTLGLATRLADELDAAADVKIDRLPDALLVTITPFNRDACGFSWSDSPGDISLEVGHEGGRWLLSAEAEDLAFLANVARSIIDGRVSEVRARARSCVTVVMPDGSSETETGYEGLAGCLPLPFWRRWSRNVQYAPYR
jgi:hypothetical protein